MVVNDILDFIRFLKERKKENTDFNKTYFKENIEPLWKKFNEIHQDYKKTFKIYSEMIIEQKNLINIIEEVNNDSIYSEDLRSELESMLKTIPPAFPKNSTQFLDDFFRSLAYYFEAKSYFKIVSNDEIRLLAPIIRNGARFRASTILHNNSDRDEIKRLLNMTFEIVQSNYKWVSDSYYSLKNNLNNR